MSIKTALVSRITSASTLIKGVHPAVAPQGATTPYVTYSLVNRGRDYTHEGHSTFTVDDFLIKTYSTSKATAEAAAATVITAIDGWKAASTDSKVRAAFIVNELDGKDSDSNLSYVFHYARVHHKY